MDCGIPFCQSRLPGQQPHPRLERSGLSEDRWREALDILHSTNNFPEFTGRVCPAPCEAACTLDINDDAGDDQADRALHHRQAASRKAGSMPCRRRRRPASASRWSARDRPAWPPRSSWHAPGTRSCSSRRTTASAGCCATAFPISRWKSTCSTAAWSRCRIEGVKFGPGVHVGKDVAADDLLAEYRRGRADRRRRAAARSAGAGPRPRRASTSRWSSCRSRTAWSPATGAGRRSWRHGQARGRDRRRRHGSGLRGHVESPAREVRHAVRAAAAAARSTRTSR